MKKTLMRKENWTFVLIGIGMVYFGFFLISFITRNYDGGYAFFSLLIVFFGIISVFGGLSIDFENFKKK